MKINKEKLNELADINGRIVSAYFFETRCKKCLNTKLQKKRDCDLLHGYKKPCCKLMDRFLEQQNKPINHFILLGHFKELLKFKNKGR